MAPPRPDFASLFREHYTRVFRYVRYRVNDETTAEDLTAEVFERAYRYRDSYDPDRGAFSTWVLRIAHNWVENHLQAARGKETQLLDEALSTSDPSPEAQIIAREMFAQLSLCLDQLNARDREIIALRFGSELRNKEIAVVMNLKEHSVSVMLMRALERLRGCQEAS